MLRQLQINTASKCVKIFQKQLDTNAGDAGIKKLGLLFREGKHCTNCVITTETIVNRGFIH
jgi:hypothetical protein